MQAYVALTQRALAEASDIIATIRSLGADPRNPPEGLLNQRETLLVRLAMKMRDEPGTNLWNQHPQTL